MTNNEWIKKFREKFGATLRDGQIVLAKPFGDQDKPMYWKTEAIEAFLLSALEAKEAEVERKYEDKFRQIKYLTDTLKHQVRELIESLTPPQSQEEPKAEPTTGE